MKTYSKNTSEDFSVLDCFFAEKVMATISKTEEVRAFLCYLMASFREGHLCVTKEEEAIYPKLKTVKYDEKKVIVGYEQAKGRAKEILVWDDNSVYLQKHWKQETAILKLLEERLARKANPLINVEAAERVIEEKLSCKALLQHQAKAVSKAIAHPFMLIFGGPGTGKTYTVSHLIQVLAQSWKGKNKLRVCLLAPTGKAATHLSEKVLKAVPSSQIELTSSTIHSALKIPQNKQSNYRLQKLDVDMVIVDESSMIDPQLFAYLLESIAKTAHLVFVGDPDQLPAIDGGAIFSDLLKIATSYKLVCHQVLSESIRFSGDGLSEFASAINLSDFSAAQQQLSGSNKCLSHVGPDQYKLILEESYKQFVEIEKKSITPSAYLAEMGSFKVLSCLRHGDFSVTNINNTILQRRLNETQSLLVPILIVENNYTQGLYNGMNAVIEVKNYRKPYGAGLFDPESRVYFTEGEKTFDLPLYSLPRWEIGYCLTVHKSQGSEYNEVVLFVPSGSDVFGRELFYTAATRVKQKLTICCEMDLVKKIISSKTERVSGLKRRWKK